MIFQLKLFRQIYIELKKNEKEIQFRMIKAKGIWRPIGPF